MFAHLANPSYNCNCTEYIFENILVLVEIVLVAFVVEVVREVFVGPLFIVEAVE